MAALRLPCVLASAPAARHRLADALEADGLPSTVVADACLVFSELVGNAVRHGRALPDGGVQVGWAVADGQLCLEVLDGGGRQPTRRDARDADPGGRGLAIVDAVAAEWGVRHPSPSRTEVWARLPL